MSEAKTIPRIVPCGKGDSLINLGVQPGWFVRHSCCTIWFEVTDVFERYVICVARDPKKGTELAFVGDKYGAINEFCDGNPGRYQSWIAKDRTKSFFDKFFPERDKILVA